MLNPLIYMNMAVLIMKIILFLIVLALIGGLFQLMKYDNKERRYHEK